MDRQIELLKQVREALQHEDFSQAIESLQEIVSVARQRGDIGATGRHLGNLALTYYRIGQPENALKSFEEALVCARQDADRMTENGLLGNMGNILRELKRHEEALDHLNKALLIAQELGDTRGRGIWLSNLGLVYGELQQWEDSLSAHEKSVKIARQLFDQGALALRLGHLGESYVAQKRYAEAIKPLQESAALHSHLGQQIEASLRWSLLGDAAAEVGRDLHPDPTAHEQYGLSMEAYGHAMEHMRTLGDVAREADTIRKVGMVLADVGQYDDAQQYLGAAEQMFNALGLNQQAERSRQTLKRLIAFLEEE